MDYNRIIVAGNIVQDLKHRTLPSGMSCLKFSVATNRHYTRNGEKVQSTSYIDVVAFGKAADIMDQHLSKGDPIFVEGHVETRSYTDKNDIKRKVWEVIVDHFQFLPRGQQSVGREASGDPWPDDFGGDDEQA